MARSRETQSSIARAVPQTLSDGSVAWNVELRDRDDIIATIGVIGGEKVARLMADRIDRASAWVQ